MLPFASAEVPEGQSQLMTQSAYPATKTWEGREGRVTERTKDRPAGADAHVCVTNDNNKGSENNNQEN